MEEDAAHFQALALSGGGFRGLYTAQLLADLEQHLGQPAATRFDLIAGTSIVVASSGISSPSTPVRHCSPCWLIPACLASVS